MRLDPDGRLGGCRFVASPNHDERPAGEAVTLLRQGEGDPRLPHPTVPDYPTTATIFQGVVERTLRAAVSGSFAPDTHLGLKFDAGLHRVSNDGHVPGRTATRFVGSVGLTYRFSRAGALP